MNIKHILLLSFIVFTSSILAQTQDDDFPDFTSNNHRYTEPQGKLIEIDISKLKKGYWLAEKQTDSIYLNILDTKCYYYDKDSTPFTAKMTVKLTHVTAEKPQKVISDNYSEIHFEYLDTLPEPRYSLGHLTNYGEKNPKIYIFKKLLPNRLILQEKGNLNNTLIFNKINTEYPLFRQVQIEKLKEIHSKVIGLWKSKIEEKYYLIGNPIISSDNWLEYPPNILTTSIRLLHSEQDSVKAEKMYSYIQWSDNLEYTMQFSSSQKDKYKIEKLDSNSISLVIDSLNIQEDYFKMPFDQFPDSILRGIKNKVWCDTIFDSYTQKIDTFMFDFGDNLDTCKYEDIFFSCSGHLYDSGLFHNIAHFDFFTFKNHCFYIKLTHGSIRLWEIVNLSSQYLTIRTTDDDDKIEIRQLFLHPQNQEYFDNQGRRMRY